MENALSWYFEQVICINEFKLPSPSPVNLSGLDDPISLHAWRQRDQIWWSGTRWTTTQPIQLTISSIPPQLKVSTPDENPWGCSFISRGVWLTRLNPFDSGITGAWAMTGKNSPTDTNLRAYCIDILSTEYIVHWRTSNSFLWNQLPTRIAFNVLRTSYSSISSSNAQASRFCYTSSSRRKLHPGSAFYRCRIDLNSGSAKFRPWILFPWISIMDHWNHFMSRPAIQTH